MATAFERAYQQTVKNMSIAREYAEERQRQIRAEAAEQEAQKQDENEKVDPRK